MKAIMVMFDSLNRHMLPPFGGDWVHAPNFARLSERTVTFDCSFVGSMPCMPARRELHTGRYNFLHRSWGPLEPFDDSMPRLLRDAGIHTHLASDHYHYWEEGGCTYHTKYENWSFNRGQEGDRWKGRIADPEHLPEPNGRSRSHLSRQDWINRSCMQSEEEMPQAKTMSDGIAYLEENANEDNWFVQIETFDPHEPYFVPEKYKELYDFEYVNPPNDWPGYSRVEGRHEMTSQYKMTNAALVSMCDAQLGRVLDTMDRLELWDDTMLIVNTDHGFLLGELDWWGKVRMPFYNEIALTPLFIWDPRSEISGERRSALVQTIDLPATLLEYFDQPIPKDMQGKPLVETIRDDSPVREAGLFGIHGGHVNVTDGRYVYMRAPASPENRPLFNYTQMPTHMRESFSIDELKTATLVGPMSFSKECPLLRTEANPRRWARAHEFGDLLFDNREDPMQQSPMEDAIKKRMCELLVEAMKDNDAPQEQYERLGLTAL